MSGTYIQASLSGGEISPALHGRVDLALYQISLKTCRNFISQAYGGCINRPGFRYVCEVKDSSKAVRLIPFVYSSEQAYVLEIGDEYMRIVKNGGQVVIAAPDAWLTSTAYTQGDHVEESGTNYYCAISHTSGTFATDLAAGKWYALEGLIEEAPTEWFEGDLPLLKYTQSADVITLTHLNYKPWQITRATSATWTVTEYVPEFGPFQEVNEDTSVTVYTSAVSGSVTLTASSGIFSENDIGKLFLVAQKDYGQAWESGKSVSATNIRRVGGNYYQAANTATTGTSMPLNIQDSWNDGAVTWAFIHPGFGIARITAFTSATVVTATVLSRLPDAHVGAGNTTYKWAFGSWSEADGYPGCTTYHQQRHFFAGSPLLPQNVWGTQVGDFTNFGVNTPILDSDAVTYPLAGRQVNQVKHLVSLGGALVALTSDSYWTLVGSDLGGALTPSSVQAKVQSYLGSSDVAPVAIANECLFVGDMGSSVRNIGYSQAEEAYVGDDLTVMASHLFEGHTIVDIAYQSSPFSVVWCVRDDGVLLGLTYDKAQKVIGWHRHDTTNGAFEAICVVPENGKQWLYAVVRRTIDGQTKRYIERMEDRFFAEQEDYFFVDSGLSYNGWNTTATTVTVSGGTTWDVDDAVTLTASSAIFVYPGTSDQGDAIVWTTDEGKRLGFTILSTSSTTVARAVPNRLIPEAYRNTARTDWGFARGTFSNMDHLEGEEVAILADGNAHPNATVSSGTFSVQTPSLIVHAGLPYTCDLVTLDLAIFNGETIRDKRKLVHAVRTQVESTRGLSMGIPGKTMTEIKQRTTEDYSSPVNPTTGLITHRIVGTWNDAGSVQISTLYPLPAHVLAVMPEVTTGGTT